MDISQFFMKGDIKGAIEYMKQREEYNDVLPLYIDIFENCNYRKYKIEDKLNQILLHYQIYYRDIFYCGLALKAAEDKLKLSLCQQVYLRENDEDMLKTRTGSAGFMAPEVIFNTGYNYIRFRI